ncbi:hypothetical protein KUCAC02_006733 [Chaenocephalus aceratus]|uniref:Uncharacterized protein n=1 Tax=Chaenocephalus aceratus TaxID=36190 RepID=A0ACB9VSK1_CHAAC|nr:hypothetical protein KUCAC02_006733 [Chaenocephalus aceratus]
MISETGNDNLKEDYLQSEASYLPRIPRLLFSRSRAAEQEAGHPDQQRQHHPGGERLHPASGLLSRGRLQHHDIGGGGILDFYLIIFTDLYWCSWIATDLVVISGWGIFFMKNARSKRERACGFHQKSSIFGCNLGEFTYAYLAWLIYVIACTPKVVLILETSILDLIELKVPCGVTGLKIIMLLSVPLLFCLINSIIEDLNGATRHRSQSCFLSTCLDLLDSFTLVEMLLRSEIPTLYLKYTVISVYFVALAVPTIWLYELTASELRFRWLWARFCASLVVNAPLLVVRCFQVYVYGMPVSVFMFKNMFFLVCRFLELVEQCVAVRGVRKLAGGGNPAQFSHCVSENDMCPHGYVNTLAVTQS